MGIDARTLDELVALKTALHGERRVACAIIGDCTFHLPWRTGDNRRDLASFAERLGLSRCETIDVYGTPTIRMDLHDELPPSLKGAFDLVIDAGTLCCCFDVARAWRNLLDMLAPDGGIFHLPALTGYMARCYSKLQPPP